MEYVRKGRHPSVTMPSLTTHLLQSSEPLLAAATTAPFLTAAATSTLPVTQLRDWLAQDRLYALSYVNFIGDLLARLRLPSSRDRVASLQWRIADQLIDCLTNIRRELKLFEDTATAESWLDAICDPTPARATRSYQDLFAGATAQGRPILVGLVILWASEECYLRAWQFAASHVDRSNPEESRDVMQRVFIPNWSSADFEAFVGNIRALVDELGKCLFPTGFPWAESSRTRMGAPLTCVLSLQRTTNRSNPTLGSGRNVRLHTDKSSM
jgi:thiaminase